jgi:hypothetical protein
MRTWHVTALRRMGASQQAAQVAGHPLAFGEALHRLGAHPHVQLLAHQLIRHAVVVAFDLDVVVDVHPRLLPLGVGETLGWQRSKSRLLEALEQ